MSYELKNNKSKLQYFEYYHQVMKVIITVKFTVIQILYIIISANIQML